MVDVVIPVSPSDAVSQTESVRITVHVQAEVVSPEVARRQANVWLLENAGNLLRAEAPELVAGERLIWRMDVMVTSPTRGAIGRVGRIEIDSATGAVLAGAAQAEEIIARAQALTGD